MFKNYVKTAYRNLSRHKAYAAINIAGLSIGIAACILLFIVVNYELSYDAGQANSSHIYRVVTESKHPGETGYTAGIPYPAREAVKARFPNITTGALFSSWDSQVTVMGANPNNSTGNKFIENIVFFADPQWFKIIQYKWLSGAPDVLSSPNATVLTKAMAEKYFGNWKNAVGKFLKIDNIATTRIVGILDDAPGNTNFPVGIITSFETMKANASFYGYSTTNNGTNSNFQVFMLLPSNTTPAGISHQLRTGFSNTFFANKGVNKRYSYLQPLGDMHFDNRFEGMGDHITDRSTLWTLSLIGVFILVMAGINFINLSTAQAVKRSKEVGIRKVLGSNRTTLFWQMMGETALIVFIAVLLAIIISVICLPGIKSIAFISDGIRLFTFSNIIFIATIAVMVTALAGLYPALILSGFSPIMALKSRITSASIGGISLRRGLVVLQFGISQVLIIGTIIAVSQMSFVHKADLGFNKDAVLVLNYNRDSAIQSKYSSFKESLLHLSGVQKVAFSSDAPSSDNGWDVSFRYDHRSYEDWSVFIKMGDEDFLSTYGIQLLAGKPYGRSDTMQDVLVNETFVKKIGAKNLTDVIGKQISIGGDGSPWHTISGVVKDFNTGSLREATQPLLLSAGKKHYSVTSVKIGSRNLAAIKEAVEKVWNRFYPEYAFTSTFTDDNINRFYRQEDQLSLLYKIFAAIAIFISCLGLYGLVSFITVQKTKEVGIRKVLGATTTHIIYLFSKEFIALIGIAFLIASPAAWYIMSHWLNNFAYRITIGAGIFIIAIVISVGIALATVGWKSFKAAIANPVKSLKVE